MLREPVSVVCWWWKKNRLGQPDRFQPADVVRLKEMVHRHCSVPHRFLCMTNTPAELDGGIDRALLDQRYVDWGGHYAKLFAFSEDMVDIAGPRALFLDLDIVILNDIAPLISRDEPFRISSYFDSIGEQFLYDLFGPFWHRRRIGLYNSSVMFLQTGALSHVWREFDIKEARTMKKRSGRIGTDQAWIEYRLGYGMPVFGPRQGVYRLGKGKHRLAKGDPRLPAPNARILFYPGPKEGRTMEGQYRHLVNDGAYQDQMTEF